MRDKVGHTAELQIYQNLSRVRLDPLHLLRDSLVPLQSSRVLGLIMLFVPFILFVIFIAVYLIQPFHNLLPCVLGDLPAILVDLGLVVKVWIAFYARKSGIELSLGVLLGGQSKLGVGLEICESRVACEL